MKWYNATFALAFALVFVLTLSALKPEPPIADDQAQDSVAMDRAKHLKQLRESIKGQGKRPADSVFKNIKTFKGVPAGRMLAIMDIGYSQSLGVSCGHCHNTNKWESDEKPQKQIAREMSILAANTTAAVKAIKGIKSESPAVNCTTCHRGAVKPALDLEAK